MLMNNSLIKQISDYYDKATDAWVEIHGSERVEGFSFDKDISKHDLFLEKMFQFKPGDKVLDAGCGVGFPSTNFAKKYPDTVFYLVNINSYQISKISQNISNMQTFKCDFNNLIFPSNYFDTIYFLESFSHSLKKQKTVDEIYRVLKPGGKVFLLDFCRKKDISKNKLSIHRRVYTHFPIFSYLLKKLFLNRKFKEDLFMENMPNFINTPEKFDTNTFYCYDKDNNITKFGEIHKDIYLNNAHVQYPIFSKFIKQ